MLSNTRKLSYGNIPVDFRGRESKCFCAPDPPPPPDYKGAAKEQGAANIDAAIVQGHINNPNVINPYGTQTTTWNGNDPTLTQTYSPEQQAIFDQSNQNKLALGELSGQGAEALKGVVGTGVDFGVAPAAPTSGGASQRVIDAMMGRVNEDYGRATDQRNSDLVAAGIRPGSRAYDDAMQLLQRGKNDASQQAVLAGYQQGNTAFGQDVQSRKDAIAELLSKRQVPLNEITALMSGSQVQNPFAIPGYSQNAQVAPAPIFGAMQGQTQYATDVYNQEAANANNLQQGLFGLGGSGIMAGAMKSDRRLKSNIVRIGTHPLGIGLYEYDIEGRHEVGGVMAQEVLTVKPEAVGFHPTGYLMVDYAQIGLEVPRV